MTNTPRPSDTVEDIIDMIGCRYVTYNKNYTERHHNFTHYQEDLRYVSNLAKQAILAYTQQKVIEGRIDEIKSTLRVVKDFVSAAVYRDLSERKAALQQQLREGSHE